MRTPFRRSTARPVTTSDRFRYPATLTPLPPPCVRFLALDGILDDGDEHWSVQTPFISYGTGRLAELLYLVRHGNGTWSYGSLSVRPLPRPSSDYYRLFTSHSAEADPRGDVGRAFNAATEPQTIWPARLRLPYPELTAGLARDLLAFSETPNSLQRTILNLTFPLIMQLEAERDPERVEAEQVLLALTDPAAAQVAGGYLPRRPATDTIARCAANETSGPPWTR